MVSTLLIILFDSSKCEAIIELQNPGERCIYINAKTTREYKPVTAVTFDRRMCLKHLLSDKEELLTIALALQTELSVPSRKFISKGLK